MPGSSGAIAVFETSVEPFALTSVAAMLPASISSPTMEVGLLFELSCMPYSIGVIGRLPPYPVSMIVGT